jgi:hypothetical protein
MIKIARFLTLNLIHSSGGLGMIEKPTIDIPEITNRVGSARSIIII